MSRAPVAVVAGSFLFFGSAWSRRGRQCWLWREEESRFVQAALNRIVSTPRRPRLERQEQESVVRVMVVVNWHSGYGSDETRHKKPVGSFSILSLFEGVSTRTTTDSSFPSLCVCVCVCLVFGTIPSYTNIHEGLILPSGEREQRGILHFAVGKVARCSHKPTNDPPTQPPLLDITTLLQPPNHKHTNTLRGFQERNDEYSSWSGAVSPIPLCWYWNHSIQTTFSVPLLSQRMNEWTSVGTICYYFGTIQLDQ